MNQTNQTQQSTQVSQEELAKTQVLNLTDVQDGNTSAGVCFIIIIL